ncbi:MAG: hypothetical protein ACR2LM_01410 [Pyrinomonadaceae bacterium]
MRELNQSASTAVSDNRQTPSPRAFQRGLYAVAGQRIKGQEAMRLLTTEEVIRVNRATVRESSTHRYWPTDVLAALLTADVIKNN